MATALEEATFLRSEVRALDEEIARVSKENRGVFVDLCECSSLVQQRREEMVSAAEGLVSGSLEALATATSGFATEAAGILETHRRNRLAQRELVHLLELLEIPQLMSTCVRNDLHELAVSIAAFSVDLGAQHGLLDEKKKKATSTPGGGAPAGAPKKKKKKKVKDVRHVLASIVAEIDASATLLRAKLAAELKEPLELAQFITTVVTLRRLDALHPARIGADGTEERRKVLDALELELQQLFMDGRDEFYAAAAKRDDDGLLETHFSAAVETARLRFFDVATQFDALFCLDDDDGGDDNVLVVVDGAAPSSSSSSTTARARSRVLLSSWLMRHSNDFVADLRKVLATQDAATLSETVQMTMFIGASLARSGADLRPCFLEPLMDAVRALSLEKWEAIQRQLLDQPSYESLNAFVRSLNDLKLCAPLLMETEFDAALADARDKAHEAMLSNKRFNAVRMARLREENPAQYEAAREDARKLEAAYQVLSHASDCLSQIYDDASASS